MEFLNIISLFISAFPGLCLFRAHIIFSGDIISDYQGVPAKKLTCWHRNFIRTKWLTSDLFFSEGMFECFTIRRRQVNVSSLCGAFSASDVLPALSHSDMNTLGQGIEPVTHYSRDNHSTHWAMPPLNMTWDWCWFKTGGSLSGLGMFNSGKSTETETFTQQAVIGRLIISPKLLIRCLHVISVNFKTAFTKQSHIWFCCGKHNSLKCLKNEWKYSNSLRARLQTQGFSRQSNWP